MNKIKLKYYYKGKNNKPLPNAVAVIIGNFVIYFSYETPIAFEYTYKTLEGTKYESYISENIWSKTTGKHLNVINPDKSIRLKHDDFERKLAEHFYNEIPIVIKR